MPNAAQYDRRLNNLAGPTEQLTGLLLEVAQDGITAFAGGGQANATQLTAQTSRIATVATSGDSVKLPAAVPGLEVTVINHGVNPMQVYGALTETINDVVSATGVSQMQNSTVLYFCATAGVWYTEGLASGFVNGLPTVSATNNITATPAGTQGTALLLTAVINRVTTVASAGDAVKLPPAALGLQIVVANSTANSMNVFPNVGDNVNGGGTNAAYAVAAGKTATLYAAGTLAWHAVLSA